MVIAIPVGAPHSGALNESHPSLMALMERLDVGSEGAIDHENVEFPENFTEESFSALSDPSDCAADGMAVIDTSVEEDSFVSPSKRHLSTHSQAEMDRRLHRIGAKSRHRAVLKTAYENEREGFFGYHGASREFRIYQDVIRYIFEEVLHMPIREDFYFFRHPGHPNLYLNSSKEFLDEHPFRVRDTDPLQGSQLLAMNIALYKNLTCAPESSPYYFVNNTNWRCRTYEGRLVPYFNGLGIDPSEIYKAFKLARSKLPSSGVLFQLFDTSGNYQLADEQTYLSIPNGRKYYPQAPVSQLINDPKNKTFPQMRMVMNNQVTLNPASPLSVKRYTLTTPEEEASYDLAMRQLFKNVVADPAKTTAYLEKMRMIWNQNTSLQSAAA